MRAKTTIDSSALFAPDSDSLGPDSSRESRFWAREQHVAGADEVGRGCLAGPVVAAALILPPNAKVTGVQDSKQLSAAKREELYEEIVAVALDWAVEFRDARFVEEHNIVQASVHAMNAALRRLRPKPAHALIDGNYFHSSECPYTTIIKGDSRSISIAAASILAKVTRDRWMVEVADAEFPVYEFARHKGYATKVHRRALIQHGPCRLHRPTFIAKIIASAEAEDNAAGQDANQSLPSQTPETSRHNLKRRTSRTADPGKRRASR